MTIRNIDVSPGLRGIVFGAIAVLTLIYYNWLPRANGDRYYWTTQLPQYYGYLGRAFARGQLHLPINPANELLSLKDPWDPAVNDPWRLHDAVLYNGRYYLYHGAGPAVILFAPWHMLTGYDLPESFAVVLLSFIAYLFLAGSLVIALHHAHSMPSPGLLALMLVVLAVGTGVPYLLTRISFYEVAIAGAYFGAAGAFFFLLVALTKRWPVCFILSGMLLGVATSSRPHVGIAAAGCALTVLSRQKRWGGVLALGLPVLMSGLGVLAYNYARFEDALEFGTHYQLAGDRSQQRLNPSLANLYPGMYYMLFCPPRISAVFPFVRLTLRLPPLTGSLPHDYFIEPTAGTLMISPVLAALALLPMLRGKYPAIAYMDGILGASSATFLFVVTIGLTRQRYQIDFVPLMVFAALVCLGVMARSWRRRRRALLLMICTPLCLWTVFSNAALGMSGPYDHMLKRRPEACVRIAKWFSFSGEHTPLLNPSMTVAARFTFQTQQDAFAEPLVVCGTQSHFWLLYAEHTREGIRLASASHESKVRSQTLVRAGEQLTLRVEYDPETKVMRTWVNNEREIEHQLHAFVLAPSQIQIGRNDVIPFVTHPQFTGRFDVLKRRIALGESHK